MELKNTVLGIELGSTRIKAVLLNAAHNPIASGSYEWENQLVQGIWTYSMNDINNGLRSCYAALKKDIMSKYGVVPTTYGAIGVSGMMHGYLPFDKNGKQLSEFRTWRNTMTGEAAQKLSALFGSNIPQRWSIAHLYQAILNGEEHVKNIAHLTTLAGYVHFMLTANRVMGVGEASGMFPIDSNTLDFDDTMLQKFDSIHGQPWKIRDILPTILPAGDIGGVLTEAGANFLDPSGDLLSGIPVAPCEGDAGTGMVATNSVRIGTGNVSAGTSNFAMVVIKHALGVHSEIDMVTTPAGDPVAMVHCNNCTSDINAWINLFDEFAKLINVDIDKEYLFNVLFKKALDGDPDCGGLLNYNYFSGEGITNLNEGRPAFIRTPNAQFTLANFMRTHLLSSLATLKIGLDILWNEEGIQVDKIYGHGGFFKTPEVGQRILSAAINSPVSVMKTAGEGGPYGMALLAAYMLWKQEDESLADYLDKSVFANAESVTLSANEEDVQGFNRFLSKYKAAFSVEKTAVEVVECLKN